MKVPQILSVVVIAMSLSVTCTAVSWKQCLRQPDDWYGSEEAIRIADNILLYQRNDGGWHKNTDMAQPLDSQAQAELLQDKSRNDSTIDNGGTFVPMQYLARMVHATKQDRFRDAFLVGFDYLLRAQYPNGGWPQFYPNTRGYYGHITFNDNAMVNVLTLLRDISTEKKPFGFVNSERRDKAAAAVARGIDCILRCQIIVDGKRLAWCAQHDEKTLKPAEARSYEKPSLSGSESVGIVRFLMQIENPAPRIIEAIESAVVWFEQVKIIGIRQINKPAPDTPRGYDKTIVSDPDAPPLWARFYEIGTNRPIFCSRDGVIRYAMADISYERRNGYSWYTSGPQQLLETDYPAWKKRLAER
ncbi:MAG: pectate lyase [Sedimentisphaerales bacterium]|nr:pectate lyase [Sedimentisphaerales bacterium]